MPERRGGRFAVGHVEATDAGGRRAAMAQLGGAGLERGVVAPVQDHAGAAGGEALRHGPAETARTPGDKGKPALQVQARQHRFPLALRRG